MNTTHEEDFVLINDNDDKRRLEFVSYTVSKLLWTGVLIGFMACVCVFGMLQQASHLIRRSETVSLLRQYWFDTQWWYWAIPFVAACIIFVIAGSSGRKMLKGKVR